MPNTKTQEKSNRPVKMAKEPTKSAKVRFHKAVEVANFTPKSESEVSASESESEVSASESESEVSTPESESGDQESVETGYHSRSSPEVSPPPRVNRRGRSQQRELDRDASSTSPQVGSPRSQVRVRGEKLRLPAEHVVNRRERRQQREPDADISRRREEGLNSIHPQPSRSGSTRNAATGSLGHSSGNRVGDRSCKIILQILKIHRLDTVSHKQDFVSFSATYGGKCVSSQQIHKDAVNNIAFTDGITLEWRISTINAKRLIESPSTLEINLSVSLERDILYAIPWTHCFGIAKLPHAPDEDRKGFRTVKLQSTEKEIRQKRLQATVDYSIAIQIGQTMHKV